MSLSNSFFLKHIEKGNKNRRLKRMSIDLSKVELFPRKHLGGIEVACTCLFDDGTAKGKKMRVTRQG